MSESERQGRRYKVRRSSGEVQYITRQELWRLQQRRAERIRRRRRRQRLTWLGSASVGLLLITAVFAWWWQVGGPRPRAAGDGARQQPAAPPRSSELATAAGEAAEEPRPAPERIAEAVERWAAAWSSQDVAAYLRCYSERFRPSDGSPRPAWEGLRRERLSRPDTIEVEILEPEVTLLEPGLAEVRFRQAYRSPGYSDMVAKTLRLVEEEGGWRILTELAEPL